MRRSWIAVVCLWVGHANADSDAERSFREGRRLLGDGRLDEACAAFEASQRAEARAGTLLNLADCHARRGFTATARTTFLQAKALAHEAGDRRREAEADRQLAAIEPQLATLTIVVAADRRVEGMTISRNGSAVDPESWNTPIALDPGNYRIDVRAPGFRAAATKDKKLGAAEHAMIVVEPLVAEAAAVVDAPPPHVDKTHDTRSIALGALLGANVQHESALFGVRAIGAVDAPGGQIRVIGTFHFSRYADEPMYPEFSTDTYSIGASADYLWMPRRTFALGGGLGIGADYDVVSPQLPPTDPAGQRENDLGTFLAIRVSPMILRLRHETLELGLHVATVIAGDEVTVNCVAAVDWFLW